MEILGFGTEIVECLRIARLIQRHGELFLRRVFTDNEINYCSARSHANQHYAARWAAKRAVMKSLGVSAREGISWRDIEIRPRQNAAATVAFGGELRDICAKRSIGAIHLALAYCRTHATASAIAVEDERY